MSDKINPLTGEPLDTAILNPETNLPDVNPLTGEKLVPKKRDVYRVDMQRDPDRAIMASEKSMGYQDDISKFTKYGVPLGQNLDWQELRARNQSTAEKWGHGLAKAGVTTLGAVAENTIGVLFGLGELATGGAYYDNVIGKAVDSTNEWMREEMPNYLTQEEQKMSTLSKLGTANFWADTVANGLGYSIGSIATMWITGGGGLLTKGISAGAKGLGIYNATKAIINGTKLASKLSKGASFAGRLRRASQMLEAGAMMSLAEASVEARETQRTVYDDLIQDYLKENNLEFEHEIDTQTLKEFEDVSYSAGNTNFAAQLPVLMGTNVLMFGKQVAGFKGASKETADVVFSQTTKKAISKLADQSIWKQALTRMRPTAMNALEEASQEGFQFASGKFAHSYHTDKYKNDGHGDMAGALSNALSETFGTQEGLESMFVGALTGGLMGSAQSTMGKEYSTRKTNASTLAKFINGGYLNNAEQKLLNANASSQAMQRMQVHLENNDIKKFKDEQFKLIQFQALEALERGGYDVFMEKLEDAKNLDNDQFMEFFGYQTKDAAGNALTLEDQTEGKSQSEVIDSLKKKIENFKETYDNVHEQFPLADKTSGLPRMLMSEENRKAEDAVYDKQSSLRTQLVLAGSEIKDRNRRMRIIQNSMGSVISKAMAMAPVNTPGTSKAELTTVLEEQAPDAAGEIAPAEEFDAQTQYNNIRKGFADIYKKLLRVDANQAEVFGKEALDYLALMGDNTVALDSYNKLSSDKYAQEQFEKERLIAVAATKQAVTDKKAEEALKNAKTSAEISKVLSEDLSPKVKAAVEAKRKEFADAEEKAAAKFIKSSLDDLYAMDREKMTPIEVEGLKKAIEIKENEAEDAKETAKVFDFEAPVTVSITDDGQKFTPNPEYKKRSQELEEAFKSENVGEVEAIDKDGREFQIKGEIHYNVEPNPLDAVLRDKDGNITSIALRDSLGNFIVIKGPESTVDALAYAILMSEQVKVDGLQELSKDEIFEKLTAFNEEVAEEISTKGDKGKHGAKTTELLREEIYSLERAKDEALEVFDQLRTYYIQEIDATKEDLKNDPELKALNRKINSIRSRIGARKRILKLRNEPTTATSSEILKVERKAMAKIEEIEGTLNDAITEIAKAEQEIEVLQAQMDKFKAAEDLESYRQASEEQRVVKQLLEESQKSVKSLKRKINYHKNKLKRLANEKSNELPGAAEQAAPGAAEETQERVDERKDTDTGAKPQEAQAPVKPVRYKVGDKTATYTVKWENGEYVVYNSKGTPVTWKEGQQKHKYRIVGKHLVQAGKAVVVEHNGKKFIVTPKYLSPSNTPFIIQEDGKIVSRAELATQQLADIFDAIIKKAAAKFRAMVSEESVTPSEKRTQSNASTAKAEQDVKDDVEAKQATPGTPKKGQRDVVTFDLTQDDPLTAAFGPQQTLKESIEQAAAEKEAPVMMSQEDFLRGNTFDIKDLNSPLNQDAVNFMIANAEKAGMDWKIGNRANVGGRPSIEIIMPNGYKFIMYKSTGEGTGAASKGKWVPVPGFTQGGHFIKVHDKKGENPKFSKYHVPLFQNIANTLESLDDALSDKRKKALNSIRGITRINKKTGVKDTTYQIAKPIDGFRFKDTNTEQELIDQVNAKFTAMSLEVGWSPKSTPVAAKETTALEQRRQKELEANERLRTKVKKLSTLIERGVPQSVFGPSFSTPIEEQIQAGVDWLADKINAKYDAELAALGREPVKSVQPKPKNPTSGNTFDVEAARDDKVEEVEETNSRGDQVTKYRIPVSEDGTPDRYDPDTIDGEPILINKEKLAEGDLIGKEVTFEIIENDWYKDEANVSAGAAWIELPIYYKIDGEIVGKLESSESADRKVLVEKLRAGEQVTMTINEVIAGNFNHSRTADGNHFFSDPRNVFDNPILAFTTVVENIPSWVIPEAGADKNVTPRMQGDVSSAQHKNIDYGQVAIVVRPENNPQGMARISMASTAKLTPKAQEVAFEAIANEEFNKAEIIVANSLLEEGGTFNERFLQFGQFKNGAGFLVFKSPTTGELIRITEANMALAAKGKTYVANIVDITDDGKAFASTERQIPADYDIVKDMKDFLSTKKYHVSREAGNSNSPITSPVTGIPYNNYQEYLFSPQEMGGERILGKGHNSILSTDIVKIDNSLFNNPKITFDKGNVLGETVQEVAENTNVAKKSTRRAAVSNNVMNELNQINNDPTKDEMDQGCPF